MKFTVSSQLLNTRLQNLAKVIASKNAMSILENFLFEVNNGVLTITTSDNENTMKSRLQLDEADSDGRITIRSRTLLEAVKELPDQPLQFDIDTESMAIKIHYQNGEYNLTGQPADEYPIAKGVEGECASLVIDAESLIDSVGRAIFATAQDELRPVMNGVYFDLNQEHLIIVATDGHKMVRNLLPDIKSEQPAAFVLPKKPATLLRSILTKEDGDVTIKFNNSNAEIMFASGSLTCRLIEGKYPNYNAVIPQNNNNKLTVDRKAFLSGLRRVLPFASESSELVRLQMTNGKIEISSEDIDFAVSAKESLICDYNGQPMEIGFRGSALLEILSNLESEQVDMLLASPSDAGIIVPTEQTDKVSVLMLIMPMLLND